MIISRVDLPPTFIIMPEIAGSTNYYVEVVFLCYMTRLSYIGFVTSDPVHALSERRQHLVREFDIGYLADVLQLLDELRNRLHRIPMSLR